MNLGGDKVHDWAELKEVTGKTLSCYIFIPQQVETSQ